MFPILDFVSRLGWRFRLSIVEWQRPSRRLDEAARVPFSVIISIDLSTNWVFDGTSKTSGVDSNSKNFLVAKFLQVGRL